jgi:pilus assembly protein Flp/PilA
VFVFEAATRFTFKQEVEVARIALAARRFIRNEEGAALAEYGILVAFIAIVAITAVTFFGSRISAKFSALGNSFT